MENKNNEFSGFLNSINWKSVIIGSIITLIGFSWVSGGYFLNMDENLKSTLFYIAVFVLPIMLGGCAAAYMNKPSYKLGVINGILAALIGLILFNVYDFLTSLLLDGILLDISYIIEDIISMIIIVVLLGALGAVIGTSIKKVIVWDRIIN